MTTILTDGEYIARRSSVIIGLVYGSAGEKIDATADIEIVEKTNIPELSATDRTAQVDRDEYFPDDAQRICSFSRVRESRFSLAYSVTSEYSLACKLSIRFGDSSPLEVAVRTRQENIAEMTFTGPEGGWEFPWHGIASGVFKNVRYGDNDAVYTQVLNFTKVIDSAQGDGIAISPTFILEELPAWASPDWGGGLVVASIPGVIDVDYYVENTLPAIGNLYDDKFNYPAICSVQALSHSNNVFGGARVLRGRINSSVLNGGAGDMVATPAGARLVPLIDDAHLYLSSISASYNPVTSEVERDMTSVSWT